MSSDGGTSWATAGKSSNRIYVTLSDPTSPKLFETLLDIGGRNAGGEATEAGAIKKIWADFQDPIPGVKRKPVDGYNKKDGQEMRYWFEQDSQYSANLLVQTKCQTMSQMLNPKNPEPSLNGVGTCYAWAALFHYTLQSMGIAGSSTMELTPKRQSDAEMLVKNWKFSGNGTSGDADYPYILGSEVTDELGVPGQGTKNPRAYFNNHFIVQIGSLIYDPSYGAGPYKSQTEWENKSVDGFDRKVPRADGAVLARKKMLTKQEITFTPNNINP